MKKWWLEVSLLLLIGTCFYLYLTPLSANKSSRPAPAASSPQFEKSAIAYTPSSLQETEIPLAFPDDIQPSKVSFLVKQPLPQTPVNKPLPMVFWGNLKLVGITFLGNNHRLNKAIIKDLITSGQTLYPTGTFLPHGVRLIQVLKDRVILEKNGMQRSLGVSESLITGKGQGYQQVADNKWLISPNRLLKDNENIENILHGVEINSYLGADGRRGLQISKLEQGSIMEELGIQEGDIVSEVNGEEIGDMKDLLLAYWNIRKSPLINLSIERNRQPIKLAYQMLPDGPLSYSIKDVLRVSSIAMLFGSN